MASTQPATLAGNYSVAMDESTQTGFAGSNSVSAKQAIDDAIVSRTTTAVTDEERGQTTIVDGDLVDTPFLELPSVSNHAARCQVATDLVDRMRELMRSCGKSSMGVSVQLFKRALSKAHDVIGDDESEANYMSIIALVENIIASGSARLESRERLKVLQQELAVGLRDRNVTYDDFLHAVRVTRNYEFPHGPVIEFGPDGDPELLK